MDKVTVHITVSVSAEVAIYLSQRALAVDPAATITTEDSFDRAERIAANVRRPDYIDIAWQNFTL